MSTSRFKGVEIAIPALTEVATKSTPLSATFPSQDLRVTKPEDDSKCWLEAKVRFQERIRKSKHPPSQENINDFLKNNVNISKAISQCEILKSKADARYDGPLGKLLGVLSTVKDVGDAVLTCAPESVSIAWGIISLLIGVGVNDMENCGQISEASTNIVTIILNCRLYENRHEDDAKEKKEPNELAHRVMEGIRELITGVLEFFWHASRKFREDKKLRKFGDIFNLKSVTNEKYQALITQYKELRNMAQIEFEDNVMAYLISIKGDNANLAARLREDTEETLKALLLPELHEIRDQLEGLQADVSEVKSDVKAARVDIQDLAKGVTDLKNDTEVQLSEAQNKEAFLRLYKELRPSDAHVKLLVTILKPLKDRLGSSGRHVSRWLFANENYFAWRNGTQNFFYIKGQAGFGKSTTMAVAIERLLQDAEFPTEKILLPTFDRKPPQSPTAEVDIGHRTSIEGCPVLYWFFKRGDTDTELTRSAFVSLVTQIFNPKHAQSLEERTKMMEVMISASKEGYTSKEERDIEASTGMGMSDMENIHNRSSLRLNASGTQPAVDENVLKLELLGEALGRTVYIVIDGVDECTDYQAAGLMTKLISLGRSTRATFKIMISSRENLDLERYFARDLESMRIFTGRPEFEYPDTWGDQGSRGETPEINKDADVLHCIKHRDTIIMTVTKSTNEADMKAYLEDSLTELLNPVARHIRQLTGREYGAPEQSISEKQAKEIQRMADMIQKKAEGMFTYSAMVIAGLNQPSPLSITQRVRRLPDQMDSLYSRHLDSLTAAQRKLVILALEMVMYTENLNTLEVIERFKREYVVDVEDTENGNMADYADDEDWEHEENVSSMGKFETCQQFAVAVEQLLEKETQKPDIVYTIHHLETAGRQFFKFADGRIDVIHNSVLDWIEKESKKASERRTQQVAITDIFQRNTSGEIRIVLPRSIVEDVSSPVGFKSEEDFHLEILIYMFEVITNPRFMDKYMPLSMYDVIAKDLEKRRITSRSSSGAQKSDPNSQPKAINQEKDGGAVASAQQSGNETRETGANNNLKPPESNLAGATVLEPNASESDYSERRKRSELYEVHPYMNTAYKLWPREKRIGEGWNKLKRLIQNFCKPEICKRWAGHIYLTSYYDRSKWLNAESLSYPGMAAAHWLGGQLLLELILDDEKLAYDFRAEAKACETSVLHGLFTLRHPHLVERIISEKRLDMDCVNRLGYTPFWSCVSWLNSRSGFENREKMIESLKIMLNASPKLDLATTLRRGTEVGMNLLIQIKDLELLEKVIENQGPNPILDIPDPKKGKTALHKLWLFRASLDAANGKLEVELAKRLLEVGCDPNYQDIDSTGPLNFAANCLNKEGVELLLKWGAQVDDDDVDGSTALISVVCVPTDRTLPMESLEDEIISIIKVLKQAGANLNIRNKYGDTALLIALYMARWKVASFLVDLHASEQPDTHAYLTQKTINEQTILHRSRKDFGNGGKVAEFVLSHLNAEEILPFLNVHDGYGKAIDAAIDSRNFKMVQVLIRHYYQAMKDNDLSSFKGMYLGLLPRIRLPTPWIFGFKETDPEFYKLLNFLDLRICIYCAEPLMDFWDVADTGVDPLQLDHTHWDAFDWAYKFRMQGTMSEAFPEQSEKVDYNAREQNWKERFPRIVAWDAHRSDKFTNITEDESSMSIRIENAHNEDGRSRGVSVCTGYPIPPYQEVFYYEVTILEIKTNETGDGAVGIGFVADNMDLRLMPGWASNGIVSYGYQSNDGDHYGWTSSDGWSRFRGGDKFGVGDTVGCAYDQSRQDVFWTLNGKHVKGFHTVKARLYPFVAGSAGFSIKTNFGADPNFPFMWNGERDDERAEDEEVTKPEEVGKKEEVAKNDEVTEKREVMGKEEATENEEVNKNKDVTKDEEVTKSEEITEKKEVIEKEAVIEKEEITEKEDITKTEDITGNEKVAKVEEDTGAAVSAVNGT
ncbi:SPRY domain-containing protein 3 [Orbilia ellipsospora]|uniref:SPRY domain-containing protein 3 n=1 Tax=Orbilia ellipsospora TaxID=2528407 RepID=A0AAV9WYW3_9PEZI